MFSCFMSKCFLLFLNIDLAYQNQRRGSHPIRKYQFFDDIVSDLRRREIDLENAQESRDLIVKEEERLSGRHDKLNNQQKSVFDKQL